MLLNDCSQKTTFGNYPQLNGWAIPINDFGATCCIFRTIVLILSGVISVTVI